MKEHVKVKRMQDKVGIGLVSSMHLWTSAHSARHLPEEAAYKVLQFAGTGNQEVPGLDHWDGGL